MGFAVLVFMFVFHSGFRAVFVFVFGVCVCVSAFVFVFRRLCLCFGVDFRLGFGLCLHFGRGFRPLFAFRAGFLLVVLNLLVSIWVAHFSGFSDLGFAHIFAHFFWFFCLFFWFFFTGS